MSKKSFKIARKPGQGNNSQAVDASAATEQTRSARKSSARETPPVPASVPTKTGSGPTTRKTIEVPEDFFFRVKMRALERKILEKELWAEILQEYFKNHPAP